MKSLRQVWAAAQRILCPPETCAQFVNLPHFIPFEDVEPID